MNNELKWQRNRVWLQELRRKCGDLLLEKTAKQLWFENFEALRRYIAEYTAFPHGTDVAVWMRSQDVYLEEFNNKSGYGSGLMRDPEVHSAWTKFREDTAQLRADTAELATFAAKTRQLTEFVLAHQRLPCATPAGDTLANHDEPALAAFWATLPPRSSW